VATIRDHEPELRRRVRHLLAIRFPVCKSSRTNLEPLRLTILTLFLAREPFTRLIVPEKGGGAGRIITAERG